MNIDATSNLELRQKLRQLVGRPARCVYKDKIRIGHIGCVKQGPARLARGFDGYMYLDMPTGEVYIDWVEDGCTEPKTFKWSRLDDFRLLDSPFERGEPAPELSIAINIRRVRPTLEA